MGALAAARQRSDPGRQMVRGEGGAAAGLCARAAAADGAQLPRLFAARAAREYGRGDPADRGSQPPPARRRGDHRLARLGLLRSRRRAQGDRPPRARRQGPAGRSRDQRASRRRLFHRRPPRRRALCLARGPGLCRFQGGRAASRQDRRRPDPRARRALMRETARAKVNLALQILGRRADGYYELDTLFAFTEDGDELEARPADALSLEIVGPFAQALAPGDNLVLRAAEALKRLYRVGQGAAVRLDKRLPVAAGLGGGSADAAAALRLLVRLWDIDAPEAELLDLAAALGADVPACLLSRTVRGQSRGDLLVPAGLSL